VASQPQLQLQLVRGNKLAEDLLVNLSSNFSDTVTEALASLVQRVERSLVIVQDGKHGLGAGIIWRQDGLIMTNNHVIARTQIAKVILADGSEFAARVIAKDPEIDLALLKIDIRNAPAAPIADSRGLRVGQLVLAVGHPWGEPGVVTAGIISGLGTAKTTGKRGSVDIVRSDVVLAPGNSGGPLVNAFGGIIGINTMIIGGDLGLAIPSHIASSFVNQVFPDETGARIVELDSYQNQYVQARTGHYP
jgi:serine protease Do